MRSHNPLSSCIGAAFLALLCLTGLVVPGAAAGDDSPLGVSPEPCATVETTVPGQGPACRTASGLWKVKLANGTSVVTHGPDRSAPSITPVTAGAQRKPACENKNPNGAYAFHAVIAWPSNLAPNETDDSYRSRIQAADGALYASAVESGSPNGADYVYVCDSVGQIKIDRVQLPTPSGSATFSSVLSDLKAKGYNNTSEKYAVWYDAPLGGYCGQGGLSVDERDSSLNTSNAGAQYALAYDCDSIMHETGHTLGAVQYNAPYSTGNGYHCWQEYDVMCYADGGNRYPGSMVYSCSDKEHFDCQHNDYFDAKIGAGEGGGAGSYLDTHWNIGECYVRFVVNYACPTSGSTTGSTATSYRTAVLNSGPLAYWRLGEASGTAASDETGRGSTATYLSGVSLGQPGALGGDPNTAVKLDGVDDYASVPNSSGLLSGLGGSSSYLNPASAITLEAWAKPSTGADFSNQKPILVKSYTSHSSPYYEYGLFLIDRATRPKDVSFYLTLGGQLNSLQVDNTAWQYGAWNHIVASYDGAMLRVYVNGVEVGSKPAAGGVSAYATPLDFGAYANLPKTPAYVFSGWLDELAVYGRALSASEVQSHKAAAGR